MTEEDELTPEREKVLAAVEARIVALRRKGDEAGAAAAMAEAIDKGELTLEEAALGYYEPDREDPVEPDWFTCWNIERERAALTAAGQPCDHLHAF